MSKTSPGRLQHTKLVCFFCQEERAPDLGTGCTVCGGSLVARVDNALPHNARTFWDHAPVLPVGAERVSLGEGNTPLIKLDTLFPDDEVYVKAEWTNVTGSFKDRGSAVAVSAAKALGAKGVICASTGNNAASVSAFAARAGLPCIVALPRATPANKIIQAKAHGAIVLEIDGNFSDAYAAANRIQAELGDIGTIIVPIGAGPMLDGIMQGAAALKDAGRIAKLPVPVGAQGAGCAPIADAYERGSDEVTEWSAPVIGMPGSINDPLRGYAADGTRTLRIIRRAGGHAVAVSDEEIRRAMLDLGQKEGMAAEPASITPLAALRKLPADLPRPIVLVVSGHALKDPAAQTAGSDPSLDIDGNVTSQDIIDAAMKRYSSSS